MGAFDQILVVCVGTICRSPMASAILTAYYPEKHIDSTGLSALVGHAADAKAVALMATHTKEQVDFAIEKLIKCFKQLDLLK